MKKLLLLLTLISFFTVNAQKKVGKIENGKNLLSEDISDIKTEWKNLLAKQDIKSALTKWEIISYDNEGNLDYFLMATTSDGITKVACSLDLDENMFFISEDKGTVTCTGCAYGCSPTKVGDAWFCSGGCGGNCTKSQTVSTD